MANYHRFRFAKLQIIFELVKSVSLLREGDGEGGAFAGGAVDGDGALVELDDLIDVVEADAEAFDIVYVSGRYAVETLKDMLLVFLADAQPVVGDRDDGVGAFGACGYLNVNLFG